MSDEKPPSLYTAKPTARTGPKPQLPTPSPGLAHLAPVRPELVAEGVATVSPTGLPRIPSAAIPWLLLAMPPVSAGLVAAAQVAEGSTLRAVLAGAGVALGTAAGIISQGYRKAPGQ